MDFVILTISHFWGLHIIFTIRAGGSAGPWAWGLSELALAGERGTLELNLEVAHIGAVGEGDAVLLPRLAKHALGHDALGVLALVVLVGLALGREVSDGALIDHVAQLDDGALDVVRGTEAKGRVPAALAGGTRDAGHAHEGSEVHVLQLDGIEKAGPREAEDVVVGEGAGVVGVGEGEVEGEVVHRGSLLCVSF